jgi:hypothetical protein
MENTIGGNDTEWVDFIELSKDELYFGRLFIL